MSLRTLETMAKKPKSKFTGMVRIDAEVLDRVNLAASLMGGTSAAAYATDVLRRQAEIDIAREVTRLSSELKIKAEPN